MPVTIRSRSAARASILAIAFGSALAACSSAGAPSASVVPSASASPAESPSSSASPSGATSASPSASASASGSAGGESLTITAVDYAFQGVPATIAAGTSITLVNAGQEAHEIVAVRRNEGVTATLEELLAMTEEESAELITFVGVALAGPGETAAQPIVLAEPGSYVFVCFIPVGTTEIPSGPPESPAPGASQGLPHFTQGMVAETTVQ